MIGKWENNCQGSAEVETTSTREAGHREQRSACGLFECRTCGYFLSEECAGCTRENLLLRRGGEQGCAVYECVRGRKADSCWDCGGDGCPLEWVSETVKALRVKKGDEGTWLARVGECLLRRRRRTEGGATQRLPMRAVARLGWYLAALEELAAEGVETISSYELAARLGLKSSLVRKDLSYVGHLGTRSRGYEVRLVQQGINELLRRREPVRIIWLGARRLLAEPEIEAQLARYGYEIEAVFDVAPGLIGERVGSRVVRDLAELEKAGVLEARAAVLALPEEQAAEAARELGKCGIESLLNLTAVPLAPRGNLVVQQGDMITQLSLLLSRCGGG